MNAIKTLTVCDRQCIYIILKIMRTLLPSSQNWYRIPNIINNYIEKEHLNQTEVNFCTLNINLFYF